MKVFTTRLKVRSYECDSYGHVNNAVYLNYMEFARMEALQENGFTLDSMKANNYLVVVRRIEIDYKLPLFMGEEIVIKTFLSDARTSSGTFTQQIFRAKDDKLCAEGKVTWVFTNLTGKPIPIPPEIREAFEMN
ncbi:MAG: thioesterase family protein [Calditrichia bacterium]